MTSSTLIILLDAAASAAPDVAPRRHGVRSADMREDVQDWAALLAAIERAQVFDRRVALMRDNSGPCGYLFAYVGQLQPGRRGLWRRRPGRPQPYLGWLVEFTAPRPGMNGYTDVSGDESDPSGIDACVRAWLESHHDLDERFTLTWLDQAESDEVREYQGWTW